MVWIYLCHVHSKDIQVQQMFGLSPLANIVHVNEFLTSCDWQIVDVLYRLAHLSYDDCLEEKKENYQNCYVLYCI